MQRLVFADQGNELGLWGQLGVRWSRLLSQGVSTGLGRGLGNRGRALPNLIAHAGSGRP